MSEDEIRKLGLKIMKGEPPADWMTVEDLQQFGQHMIDCCTDPLLREKIAAILAGQSVNH